MDRLDFTLAELKFAGGDEAPARAFSGYGAVFGNLDSYGDVIAKGAFKRMLRDYRKAERLPPMLAQHGGFLSAADLMPIGVWTRMVEDDTGLPGAWKKIPCHEMFALIDISQQNLEDSAFDLEAEIRAEAEEQFALAEGTAVVTGSGVGKPLGWQNAGLTSTHSGTATTVADAGGQDNGLVTLFHSLKTAYTRNAYWAMNRLTLGSAASCRTPPSSTSGCPVSPTACPTPSSVPPTSKSPTCRTRAPTPTQSPSATSTGPTPWSTASP